LPQSGAMSNSRRAIRQTIRVNLNSIYNMNPNSYHLELDIFTVSEARL
jgi:hypothetical protein